ncbi:MAG: enoyl-CoA hydratase [Mycobacteriaceae bacterium]|nr:enoyl-CoA hydratase [Mycobacteriaceae bacterium]
MIGVRREGEIVTIELQREDRRNALNMELLKRLDDAVDQAARDARAIVLTGRGPLFCAGADLAELNAQEFADRLLGTLQTIDSVPVPVIAAVNGGALGAGTQLAMAADLRVLAPDSYVGIPVAKLGIAVDRWTVHRLMALAGNGPARTMLFGAEQLTAASALAHGFANKIGTVADAQAWARDIAQLAPLTLRHLKLAFNDDGSRDGEPSTQRTAQMAAWLSRDAVEGIRARTEKRTPKFTGK